MNKHIYSQPEDYFPPFMPYMCGEFAEEYSDDAFYIVEKLESMTVADIDYACNLGKTGAQTALDINFAEYRTERKHPEYRFMYQPGNTMTIRFIVSKTGNYERKRGATSEYALGFSRPHSSEYAYINMPEWLQAWWLSQSTVEYRHDEKIEALRREAEAERRHKEAMVATGRAESEDEL